MKRYVMIQVSDLIPVHPVIFVNQLQKAALAAESTLLRESSRLRKFDGRIQLLDPDDQFQRFRFQTDAGKAERMRAIGVNAGVIAALLFPRKLREVRRRKRVETQAESPAAKRVLAIERGDVAVKYLSL